MAYISNIPTASQRLKDSQPQIQANFTAINNFVNVNHVQFNNSASGKHNFVEMPLIATGAPYNITGTAVGETALFTKASVLNASNPPALWFAKQSTLLANAIEVSEFTAKAAVSGFPLPMSYLLFYLFQGLKILTVKYPPTMGTSNFPFTIIYPDGITFANTYGIQTQLIASGGSGGNKLDNPLNVFNITGSGFDMTARDNLGSTIGFFYTVIGN